MRARDLAVSYPAVALQAEATGAAALLAPERLPGLMVLDEQNRPYTVLPASQVIRFLVPGYVQADPSLARVFTERHADQLGRALAGRTVRELLPRSLPELPVVDGDATALEVAAVMARVRTPLVAVVDKQELLGAITAQHLLDVLLPGS